MFPCPHCGEPVPDDAEACPHCGSDDETGWHPEAEYRSLDLPDDNDELGRRPGGVSNAFAIFLVGVAILGIVALAGSRALRSPLALIAAAGIVAGILAAIRRRR